MLPCPTFMSIRPSKTSWSVAALLAFSACDARVPPSATGDAATATPLLHRPVTAQPLTHAAPAPLQVLPSPVPAAAAPVPAAAVVDSKPQPQPPRGTFLSIVYGGNGQGEIEPCG